MAIVCFEFGSSDTPMHKVPTPAQIKQDLNVDLSFYGMQKQVHVPIYLSLGLAWIIQYPLTLLPICRAWSAESAAQKIDVGVIMDQQSLLGKVSNYTMTMALEDFYNGPGNNYTTRLVLNGRDSKKSIKGAASAGISS
ncbi:glutamate receptor 2.8-like protein [Cinnamomum micranthum f. kanehirae]|uniref:Glutamate receptor 2.8-like protein n=1 Tax=Cinnamomum micranthum f. kanehirae TaxID=337451 RepID=A0A443P0N0_9MAGN|nr:glutamate receptor 2.8-like protein [Cinnamomum micranthum f. kanehirae]